MASSWGKQLRISIFGESHGPAIGVVMDGLPAGQLIDLEQVKTFLARRAPGRAPWSTERRESDEARILSGFYQGRTSGTPLTAVIENRDMRPEDYSQVVHVPRPSHADYTGGKRYRGYNDPRGGGHFSGRLTSALCFAGAVAKQILSSRDIMIGARICAIGGIYDQPLDSVSIEQAQLKKIACKPFPVWDDEQGRLMMAAIETARREQDSLGGIIECFGLGLPAGLGDPIFEGLKSRLASILYGIPAVTGVSFGAGFAACNMRGSEHNDAFFFAKAGEIRTKTNRAGGLNGGITNGMPLVINVGVKPTSTIGKSQDSVDLSSGETARLQVAGRHDPCIVPRAVPAVEAAVALGILDALLIAHGVQSTFWED